MSSTDTDMYTVMASVLPTRLADAAFLYWDSLPSSIQKDYDSVKEKLRDVFGPIYSLPFFQTHVNARPRRSGEILDVYSADITRLVLEAFPNYDHNALEGEKFCPNFETFLGLCSYYRKFIRSFAHHSVPLLSQRRMHLSNGLLNVRMHSLT